MKTVRDLISRANNTVIAVSLYGFSLSWCIMYGVDGEMDSSRSWLNICFADLFFPSSLHESLPISSARVTALHEPSHRTDDEQKKKITLGSRRAAAKFGAEGCEYCEATGPSVLSASLQFPQTIQRLLQPSNLAGAEKERNKQILYLHIHPQASSFVVVGSVTLPTVMISMFIKKEQMELRKIHTRSTELFK